MHGSVCFGCSGNKQVLTPAGAKASKAVKAFMAENFSVPVESLTPGMRIRFEGVARTVESVTSDGTTGSSTAGGVTTVYEFVALTVTKPVRGFLGPFSVMSMPKGTMVQKAVAGADWDAVVAFARTLKGKGVTVETTEVAAPAAA
jgi:hypothetical protein